jgi:hypothetical protein
MSNAATLYEASLDEDLKKQVMAIKPELFDKPQPEKIAKKQTSKKTAKKKTVRKTRTAKKKTTKRTGKRKARSKQ